MKIYHLQSNLGKICSSDVIPMARNFVTTRKSKDPFGSTNRYLATVVNITIKN